MIQKMKRALWVLVCLMAMGCANARTIVTVDGLQYSLSGAYATVYGVATGNTSKKIVVPATIPYEGLTYTVNEIGENAFHGQNEANRIVQEIILPNTIKTIGYNAFGDCIRAMAAAYSDKYYESHIQNVKITGGVTSIGNDAFSNRSITTVELAEGIISIGAGAFRGSKVTSLKIPSSVTYFGHTPYSGTAPFYGCPMLRELIYLSPKAPLDWTATSLTYVPSKKTYENPQYSINNANIIEMISFSDDTFTYTGKAPNVTWMNNMEGYTVQMTMPTLSAEVGTHEVLIPATFTKDEESFDVQIPYSYTIQPVTLKAKVNDASRLYGEENPEFEINYTGFINGDDESALTTKPTATTTAQLSSGIGTYPITISGGVAKNYQFEYEGGTLTVNKAPLTISVNETSKVYGQDNPTFSLNYVGLKNEESAPKWTTAPTFTTDAAKTSDVGTYTVNVACEPTNYEATLVEGKLNVTQAPLAIKANNATRQYFDAEPIYTFTYSGFVNGDTEDVLIQKPTMGTEANATSNVGNYALTPQTAAAKNYAITYKEGTLTITQRPLTVKVVSITRGYGESNPTFSILYEGFVNDETDAVLLQLPTTSTSANINSNVGTYDIRVSGGRAFNYALTYQGGQLTITPQPLKVSVGNYERAYNEENPRFTLIYEGFKASDTEYALQTRPVARTTAIRTSDVGTYPIEVTGGYSPNYVISCSGGTLTITKAEQSFTWEQDLYNLQVYEQVELQAIASSGLPVTYTMESIDGAELYPAGKKTYLECKAPCEFVITAIQNGNDNYYSTQRITKRVRIIDYDKYHPDFTSALYATFYDSQADYVLPSGLTASVITGMNDGKLVYETIAEGGKKNNVIPKGVAVMLTCVKDNSISYTLMPTKSETTYTGTNWLHGSDEATMTTASGSNRYYKLSYGPSNTKQSGVVGWYWGATNGGAFHIEGHKAWLAVPTAAGAPIRSFSMEGDATDIVDIEATEVTNEDGGYYDLQGRRVPKPATKGIYIHKGKKIIIR